MKDFGIHFGSTLCFDTVVFTVSVSSIPRSCVWPTQSLHCFVQPHFSPFWRCLLYMSLLCSRHWQHVDLLCSRHWPYYVIETYPSSHPSSTWGEGQTFKVWCERRRKKFFFHCFDRWIKWRMDWVYCWFTDSRNEEVRLKLSLILILLEMSTFSGVSDCTEKSVWEDGILCWRDDGECKCGCLCNEWMSFNSHL
jgi:hypothetical protein